MNKKSLASLELAAIINELKFLVKGKVSQIYHHEREILLQLHARGEGKKYLKIVPGKFLSLSEKKEAVLRPSGFCMQLRKHLSNAFIKNIYQKDSERIIIFEFEKANKYFLIIELFSKGNILLTDQKYNIIGALETQKWKDRIVKVKERYVFPKAGINWKDLKEDELKKLLKKSEKKNLATSLATELGLGGLYAEEICKISGIDSKKLPKEADEKEIEKIVSALKEIMKRIESPQGYIYQDQITPFPLEGENAVKILKTYNSAINMLQPHQKESPYEKKISAIKRIISGQEEAIKKLEGKIELNKQKGELVYEKYSQLQKMLDIVNEMKKSKEWKEISIELKKEKKITRVDLKNKKITIEF